jgi:hypothetical protein
MYKKGRNYDKPFRRLTLGMASAMSRHGSGPVLATKQSYAIAMGMVQQQASTMAFVNAFWVVAVIMACRYHSCSNGPRDLHSGRSDIRDELRECAPRDPLGPD